MTHVHVRDTGGGCFCVSPSNLRPGEWEDLLSLAGQGRQDENVADFLGVWGWTFDHEFCRRVLKSTGLEESSYAEDEDVESYTVWVLAGSVCDELTAEDEEPIAILEAY